jgi:prepilin-type processing-associated H-X9-DG protein
MGQSWAPLDLENSNLPAGVWPGFWDYAPILHSEGAIFSFADGHAEYHLWTDLRTIGDADGSIPRTTYPPVHQTNNGDVAWIAQYGWGINTLY